MEANEEIRRMQQPKNRILIVDDHPVVRSGLKQMIDAESDLTVCGEAENAGDAQHRIAELNPDLVLLDLTMEGMSGLEFTKQLQRCHPSPPVLIVSMHDEALYAERALCAGARGYVMKRTNNREIVLAVQKVLRDQIYVSDHLREKLPADALQGGYSTKSPIERLTDRELEIFLLQGQGLQPRHMAEDLCISVKTVEVHRQSIKQKLHLESASRLAQYAVGWYQSRNAS